MDEIQNGEYNAEQNDDIHENAIFPDDIINLVCNLNIKPATEAEHQTIHMIEKDLTSQTSDADENNPYLENNKKFKLMLKNIAESSSNLLSSEFECNETPLQTQPNLTMKQTNDAEIQQIINNLHCTECSKDFSDVKEFSEHESIHLKKQDEIGVVPKTSSKFPNNFDDYIECVQKKPKLTYKCRVCHKVFHGTQRATDHMVVHTRERNYICSTCDERFLRRSALYKHRINSHSNMNYMCKICKKFCKNEYSLSVHYKIHIKTHPYSCHICSYRFKNKNGKTKHMVTHKKLNDSTNYEKPKCTEDVNLHVATDANKSEYFCFDCGKFLAHSSSYYRHCRNIHNKNMNKFIRKKIKLQKKKIKINNYENQFIKEESCDTYEQNNCSDGYSTRRTSKLSMANLNDSTALKGKVSKYKSHESKSKLNKNVDESKINEKIKVRNLFRCKICSQHFDEDELLKVHEEQSHGSSKNNELDFDIFFKFDHKTKFFTCSICNKNYIYKRTAVNHILTHTKAHKLRCSMCSKVFLNPNTSFKHKLFHFYELKYSCDICGRFFSDKNYRDNFHMITHADVDPYICHVCNKTFKKPGDHSEHMNTHSGNKSHQCKTCKMKFSQKNDLKIHLLIHTWDFPLYICLICDKNFTSITLCYKHLCAEHKIIC